MPGERLDLRYTDVQQLVDRAVRVLDGHGMVILPTETMYALAGRTDSPEARRKLRRARVLAGLSQVARSSPSTSSQCAGQPSPAQPETAAPPPPPLTPHVPSAQAALDLLGPSALPAGPMPRRLMQRLWPGPVGLVFDLAPEQRLAVAGRLGAEMHDVMDSAGRLTLRCPDDPVAQAVLAASRHPVACTQAVDELGRPAHELADVASSAIELADLAIDAGPTRFTKPSTLLHVFADRFSLLRAGVYDQRIVDRMLTTTLLFVCSGNTCRSPMAMALARKMLAEKLGVRPDELESRGYRVLSAGTMAFPGKRATTQAVQAAGELGADLTTHRAQPLTIELIHQAQTIYTMGRSHREMVLALVPGAGSKTTNLDPEGDIEDPIGSDVAVYRDLALKLQRLLSARLAELSA